MYTDNQLEVFFKNFKEQQKQGGNQYGGGIVYQDEVKVCIWIEVVGGTLEHWERQSDGGAWTKVKSMRGVRVP